jgi:glycosyltransferase involved in cell wall biosynthesis
VGAPRVSIIIPTRNEESSIGRVIDEISNAMRDQGPYEVIVVDTDSTDRTVEVAREKGARVVPEPRRGYGRAYKTGFAAARGDVIVTLDADLTYPAERIPEFIRYVTAEGAQFVSGNRIAGLAPGAMSGMHRLGNRILSAAFRLLFRFPIRDSQSGMWAFPRSLLDRLELVHDGMAFSEEMKLEVIRRGLLFQEVPIPYRARMGEKKIRSVRDAFENLAWLFRKRLGWVPRPGGATPPPRTAAPPSTSGRRP